MNKRNIKSYENTIVYFISVYSTPHSENVITFAICCNTSFLSWKIISLSREEKIRRREETSQNIEENVLQEERMAQVTTFFLI